MILANKLGNKIYRKDKSSVIITSEGSGLYYYFNYPKIYIKDKSVNIRSLDNGMGLVLDALTKVAYELNLIGFIITSGNDWSHGGSSGYNSLHYKNRAIDISFREAVKNKPINGVNSSSGIVLVKLRSYLVKNYDIVIESNHIHIEYDPYRYITTVTEQVKQIENKESIDWEWEPIKYVHTDYRDWETDRKSTRLNSSHSAKSRMPSSA